MRHSDDLEFRAKRVRLAGNGETCGDMKAGRLYVSGANGTVALAR